MNYTATLAVLLSRFTFQLPEELLGAQALWDLQVGLLTYLHMCAVYNQQAGQSACGIRIGWRFSWRGQLSFQAEPASALCVCLNVFKAIG